MTGVRYDVRAYARQIDPSPESLVGRTVGRNFRAFILECG
jgi:hypothetical protein